uniref:Uncharacterized protein n=1 Tax=Ignisphaera aggregans TaxID=334771 RepID=A0A7C4FHS1_9CREN
MCILLVITISQKLIILAESRTERLQDLYYSSLLDWYRFIRSDIILSSLTSIISSGDLKQYGTSQILTLRSVRESINYFKDLKYSFHRVIE